MHVERSSFRDIRFVTRPTRRDPDREETWRPLHGNLVSKTFLRRLRAAGVEDSPEGKAALHSIRSTAATWLALAEFSELHIALLLGHRLTRSVTQRYVHLQEVPGDVVDFLDRRSTGMELSGNATDADTAESV